MTGTMDEGAAGEPNALPIDLAPRDGTILRLRVRYKPHGKDVWTPLEDAEESWTIGFNSLDNTGEDRWQFVGWDWSQDYLLEAPGGEVIGWLPFHSEQAHPSPTPAADADADADRVREPNLFWSAESWEYTHPDLTEAYEEATGGTNSGVVKIGNALEMPAIWAVQIDIDTTGDGEADDYEIKTFLTKEEADAYLADALKSTAAKEGHR